MHKHTDFRLIVPSGSHTFIKRFPIRLKIFYLLYSALGAVAYGAEHYHALLTHLPALNVLDWDLLAQCLSFN